MASLPWRKRSACSSARAVRHGLRANVGGHRPQRVGQALGQRYVMHREGALQLWQHRGLPLYKAAQHLGIQTRFAQGTLQTQVCVQARQIRNIHR